MYRVIHSQGNPFIHVTLPILFFLIFISSSIFLFLPLFLCHTSLPSVICLCLSPRPSLSPRANIYPSSPNLWTLKPSSSSSLIKSFPHLFPLHVSTASPLSFWEKSKRFPLSFFFHFRSRARMHLSLPLR